MTQEPQVCRTCRYWKRKAEGALQRCTCVASWRYTGFTLPDVTCNKHQPKEPKP